jgi:hypothetical protein
MVSVELDDLNGQEAQRAQRRRRGAEVVERDPNSELAQLGDCRACSWATVDSPAGLVDFDLKREVAMVLAVGAGGRTQGEHSGSDQTGVHEESAMSSCSLATVVPAHPRDRARAAYRPRVLCAVPGADA